MLTLPLLREQMGGGRQGASILKHSGGFPCANTKTDSSAVVLVVRDDPDECVMREVHSAAVAARACDEAAVHADTQNRARVYDNGLDEPIRQILLMHSAVWRAGERTCTCTEICSVIRDGTSLAAFMGAAPLARRG